MEQRQDSASPGRIYMNEAKEWPNLAQVDWQRAPGKFKRYTDCASLPLDHGALSVPNANEAPARDQFGKMLSAMYGITRVRCTSIEAFNRMIGGVMPQLSAAEKAFHLDLLSSVPSGGGLSPGELYLVAGEGQEIPAGVYHYDALHHALDVISPASALPAIRASLAEPGDASPAFALIISCFFWKNAFKYGKFSYRLHCLDLGVLIAQCMEVARQYGWRGSVNYQFLDAALNEILGLDARYESVYAVLPFQRPVASQQRVPERAAGLDRHEAARQASAADTPALSSWPLLESLHKASMMQTRRAFRPLQSVPAPLAPTGPRRALPRGEKEINLFEGTARRHSARYFFQPGMISREHFTRILQAAARGYTNDIDGDAAVLQHTLLYCLVNAVEDIEPGVYCYLPAEQALIVVREENVCAQLQRILPSLTGPNPHHVSLSIFPVGSYEEGFRNLGDRWYRIQNMEAGMVIQRLYLAAATLKLGCHTALAYLVDEIDRLLLLAEGLTALGMIMLAPEWIAGQYYEMPAR